MHNGTRKVLVLFIYSIKCLNEPFLLYESFLDNTILLIPTLSVLIVFLFLRNAFFINIMFIECQSFLFHIYTM